MIAKKPVVSKTNIAKKPVISKEPIKTILKKPVAKQLTIKEMAQLVEKHYEELEGIKQLTLVDSNSQSDFANLHRDAEQYKKGLRKWYKYLES